MRFNPPLPARERRTVNIATEKDGRTIKPNRHKLDDLIPMNSRDALFKEVLEIMKMISADFDTSSISRVYYQTIDLYEGNRQGYRACNTGFHDLRHSIDTLLAMARILHGAIIDGHDFTHRQMLLSLITAVLHDAGYIQEDHDNNGTGAKHTVSHIRRSMDFLKKHSDDYGLTDQEIIDGQVIILCTDLAVDIEDIAFPSPTVELLGKMLATADLLAQMADRTYLEKLLFLYHEFSEARVGDYESELDLLQKTVVFFDFIKDRIERNLGANDRFMVSHFKMRWNIPRNLYQDSIQKHRQYLLKILEASASDPRKLLRRNNIVDRVRKIYG